jgi:hypothetical protein
MSTITVTLLNWRRPENMSQLLDSLAGQTLRPTILFWNNGATFLDARLDLVVHANRNVGCWPRWFLGAMAETDYVCTIDDDLALKDDRVLEDLVRAMDEDAVEDRMYGLEALVIHPGETYRDGLDRHRESHTAARRAAMEPLMPVDVVKARLVALHRAALETVPLLPGMFTEEDIALCGLLARGRRQHHREVVWLRDRVVELPAPHATWHQPGHPERREAARRRFLP